MTSRRDSLGVRVYRRLLRLLPRDFRGEFGDSMALDFRDRDRELAGGARGRLWSRELPDLVRTAIAQHVGGIWRDVRFTLRMMARSPGFTAAAVFMLALGTGANAAMFSVIDAVMLRSAYRDAGRIAAIQEQAPGTPVTNAIPAADLAVLAQAPMFEAVAGLSGSLAVMTGHGEPRRIDVECVSPSMFGLLGVGPLFGRTLVDADDRPGAPPVIVIGYRLWQQDFGGDPDVLGRTITLRGNALTIVGVMPEGYLGAHLRNRTDAWTSLGTSIGQRNAAGCYLRSPNSMINAVARVRPSRTLESAMAELDAMGIAAHLPRADGAPQPSHVVLDRADDIQLEGVRAPFLALLGAVGCVLLIACANVANLQLERLIGRRKEMTIRLALGATRGRILRQTLVENLLVSLLGAGAGLIAAQVVLRTIVSMIPANVPHVREIALNGRTLAVTLVAAIVAGVSVALVPALQAMRLSVTHDLNQSSSRVAGGAVWIRRGLVVTEVALSVVLLISAVLMLRTFLVLRPTDPGFRTENRTVAEVLMGGAWTPDPARERFVNDMIDGIRRMPGVRTVSATSYLPLWGYTELARITISATPTDIWASWTTPGYFEDMGMMLVRGRLFDERDRSGSPPVMMVNEAAARKFWPGADAIGQAVDVRSPDGVVTSRQIVGVIHTTRSWGTDTVERPELYIPYAQGGGSTLMYFIVGTAGAPPRDLPTQISTLASTLRPGQLVDRIEPLQASLDRAVQQPRFGAWLFGAFAAIAVGLAGLGLAAVITWWVTQRRREIGVRMALGASGDRIARLILSQALWLTLSGVAIGLLVAAWATRLVAVWLYGVAPLDPMAFGLAAAGMTVIAALAAYVPARRASRIDPIVTLRSE